MSEKVAWLGARPNNLQLVEQQVLTWYFRVPVEMPFDELLKPDFWTNVGSKLSPHNRILVDADDGSWTALLFVRSAARISAVVEVISKTEFSDIDLPRMSVDEFDINFLKGSNTWRIKRGSKVLEDGFDSKHAASAWLGNYLKNAA